LNNLFAVIFQYLSETAPKNIHTTDSVGMTALHCAVACSSVSNKHPCYLYFLPLRINQITLVH